MAAPININANLNLNPASINASAKQVQQALGRITGQASEFQKSLDASTARVFAFGATTSVINGITQSFKSLVSTTINVEAKLKEINSILGAGATEFNKYRNSIFQVAKTTGQSFNTVAEGAAELARQGLGATESAKRLEAALILTRISGLGAEQSVKALTAAMNGFTSAGLTANQVVNKIVAVDTAFAVSAQDLAEGFSRAGSTAEDAGVSFNELLGLITAVEQRTARGGAVIGNAFKSIFTRLSRGSTIEDLKALGVAIDANQTGVQKLKALSDALQNISDPTVASQIKELAGGVFQINVVSAALKDIGDEASVFGKATKEAFNAANQATEKNAALNETLLANLNSLIVSVTSLGEKIGNLTFGPLLQNLVGIATSLSESLDSALDPEKGSKFIQNLFKVIGTFISGPGLAIFTVAFAKIFKTVIKFAKEGFKSVMEIGSATERIKQIENGLIGLLQKDSNLRDKLLSTTATQAQKEQAVISAIQKENQLLAQQRDLVSNISNIARRGGVTGFDSSTGSFKGKRGRRYAAGGAGEMEPNLMTAMMNEARDAPSGAMPYVTNFRGKPAVMNTSEMQVRINGREEILREDQIPRFNKGTGKGSRGLVSKGKYAFLIPKVGAKGSLPASKIGNQKFQGGATVRGPQKNAIKGASDSQEANIEGQVKKNLFSSAAKWTQKLKPLGRQASVKDIQRGFQSIAGAKGALKAAVGSAFEVGITKSLDYNAAQREKGGDFDVRGGSNIDRIQKLFGIRESIADFKASQSSGNIKSFYSKVAKEKGAGAITKKENEDVARRRAIERDRRKNPQFYTKKGDLKRGSSELDRSQRIAGSLKFFRGLQKSRFAKGSLPNLKVRRYNEGSMDMGIDPMMLMMMAGGMGGSLGGGSKESGAEMSPLETYKEKIAKRFSGRKGFMKKHMPTFQSIGRNTADLGRRVSQSKFGRGVAQSKLGRGTAAVGRSTFRALGNRTPSLRGGVGLSIAGAAIGSQAENVREATGSDAAGAFTKATGSITEFAATGAALAGPLGAAAGAAAGLVKSMFDSKKAIEEFDKQAEEFAKPDGSKFEASQVQFDILGQGNDKTKKQLGELASKTGIADLDISDQLMQAQKAFAATKKGTSQFVKAQREYTKIAKRARKLMDNSNKIQTSLNNIRQIDSKLAAERRNNVGAKFGEEVGKQQLKLDVAQQIQGFSKQGRFSSLLNRDIEVSSKIAETAQAKSLVEQIKSDLKSSTNEDETKQLQQALAEASQEFKNTVISSAIFMQKKQVETSNEIARSEARRAELLKQRSTLNLSDAGKAGGGDTFDVSVITDFQEEVKRIRKSVPKEDRAQEFAYIINKLQNSTSSLSDSRRETVARFTTDKLSDDEKEAAAKTRFTNELGVKGGNFYQDEIFKAGGQGDIGAELAKNAETLAALSNQQRALADKMAAYGDQFDATKLQADIKRTNQAFNKAADNFAGYQAASEAIGGISDKVIVLAEKANVAIDQQNAKIDILMGRRKDEEKDVKKLIGTEG